MRKMSNTVELNLLKLQLHTPCPLFNICTYTIRAGKNKGTNGNMKLVSLYNKYKGVYMKGPTPPARAR